MMEVPCSDLDFYERKIKRLEGDVVFLQEELNSAKFRARNAEDYQIKYQLLLRQSEQQFQIQGFIHDQSRDEQFLQVTKHNDQKWMQIVKDSQDQLNAQSQQAKKQADTQYDLLLKKYNEVHAKKEEMELFSFKIKKYEKENQSLRDQIQEIKNHHQKQKQQELQSIKSHLNLAHREKINNLTAKYEEKIQKLQKVIHDFENKKDQEQIKAVSSSNAQLQKLKDLLDEKHRVFTEELEKLQKQLQKKNLEIKKMLQQNIENQDKHLKEQSAKRQYIKQLENKLFENEKQHEIQIINLIERMKKVKEQEIEHLKNQENRELSCLLTEKNSWNDVLSRHKDEMASQKKQFEDERNRLGEEKNQLKKKMNELSLKLKQLEGDREVGDTQMLINSLKDLDQKEEQFGNYENGIVFLERQLKKKALKLEEKNRQISKLNQDLFELNKVNQQEIHDLKDKFRTQKRQINDRNNKLEGEVRELNDNLRTKERDLKKKEKDISAERLELEERNRALTLFVEELQRDYNRVIENKKNVETSYRDQREKGITSKADVNVIKRQKWLELQKQKNQLEVIFKEKANQIRIEKEAQIDHLQNQLNKLKHNHDIAIKESELLQKQNDRLANQLQLNKENNKQADYTKKMATLNLEIALTQNIYDSLLKAKSRGGQEKSEEDGSKLHNASFAESSLHGDREASLFESFNPSAYRK